MSEKPSRDGLKWSRDETILALGLYFQLPWGRIHHRTPEIVSLAQKMGRTPSSLAMKLANIGHCDPTLTSRGVGGLSNGGKVELRLWNEFANRRDLLSFEYDRCLKKLGSDLSKSAADDVLKVPTGMDGVCLTRYRINQSFFRGAVLAAYSNSCCITGINEPRLLIASHIRPWSKCKNGDDRTNVQNGLCLNALHDKAFDKGLITIDSDFKIVLSSSLREMLTTDAYNAYFKRYEGEMIRMPNRSKPCMTFIDYHNHYVFVA